MHNRRHQKILFALGLLVTTLPSWAQKKPQLSVSSPAAKERYHISATQLPLKVLFSDVECPCSIGFWVERNIPESERAQNPAYEGPIMVNTLDAGVGEFHYMWDMTKVPCMKNGYPDTCESNLPEGAYRIQARLFTKTSSALLGSHQIDPESAVASGRSGEFFIYHKSEEQELEERLQSAATYKLIKLAGLDTFEGMDLKPHMTSKPTEGPDKSGKFCRQFYPTRPFSGSVLACSALAKGSPVSVGGKLNEVQYLRSYTQAKERAFKVVSDRYKSRTNLKLTVVQWFFNIKPSDVWTFVVKAESAEGSTDKFQDIVVTLVGGNTWECIHSTVVNTGTVTGKYDQPMACFTN